MWCPLHTFYIDPKALEQFAGCNRSVDGNARRRANAIVWLCSDEVSFATGNAYPVDVDYLAL